MEVLANRAPRHTQSVRSITTRTASCLHLVIFLLTAALSGCGGGGGSAEAPSGPRTPGGINISGKAAVEGTPLTGAVVAISKLDITQASETKSRRGKIVSVGLENFQPAVAADGVFSFQLPNDLLQDDILYSLSLTCPKPVTNACPLQVPLHLVLSGSRLKQSGFTANVLTEVVYQRLGYYIAVGFKAPELQQEMNALARMLLEGDIDGENGVAYEDVLRWEPAATDALALKRPGAVTEITTHLIHSEDAAQINLSVQTLFSPIASNLKTNDAASLIAVEGNYAYVSVGPSEIYAVDISQPLTPKLQMNKVQIPGAIEEMTLVPPYIYVTYHSSVTGGGLQIVDISNPQQPLPRGNTPLNGTPSSVQVVDSYAYIAYKPANDSDTNLPSGLHIVDVSNINAPQLSADLNLDDPENMNDRVVACGVAVAGSFAYVTDNMDTIHTIDINNPKSPKNIDATATLYVPGRPCEIEVNNNSAYIATEHRGLQILSLEDPAHPVRVTEFGTLGMIRRLLVSGNFVYLTDSAGGLMIADITNPEMPKLVNAIDTPHSANDVALAHNFAYVADAYGGIQIIDFSAQPAPPFAGSIASGGVDVVANGDFAYVLSGYPGLKIIDTHDIRNPVLYSGIEGYNVANSINLNGNYVFASIGGHIDIFDVSNPKAPEYAGKLDTPGQGKDVALEGKLAFVAHGHAGLQVVNIADPTSPKTLEDLDTPGGAHGVDVAGDYAYIADSDFGLQIIEFSQSDEMEVTLKSAGSVDTPGLASEVVISGKIAYVADSQAGLQLIDISTPGAPRLISGVDTPGNAIDVAIVNSIAYVADDYAGVQVIDVRDPNNPILLGAARTNSGAVGISAAGKHIYVITHYDLEILHAIPTE